VRQLRALAPRLAADGVRELVAGRREADVRRALAATRRARPEDPVRYFAAALGRRVESEVAPRRAGIPPLRTASDPYAS
jgi:hypothetical protein